MNIYNVHFLSLSLCLLMITVMINAQEIAESPSPPPPPYYRSRGSPFRPSIVIVVAILTTIFSIVFMLLLYAKHCKREGEFGMTGGGGGGLTNAGSSSFRKNSGIDRTVIESLPVFRFGSLRGQKAEGLECAVCLNKFESTEILRLLPKCKHAFHVECVDTWLDAHSTCPLCRYQVDPEDILLISHENERKSDSTACSASPAKEKEKQRMYSSASGRHSSAGERGTSSSSLQIIVETPKRETPSFLNKRMSLDSWNFYRKKSKSTNSTSLSRKDGMLLSKKKAPAPATEPEVEERRLEHRIIISGDEPELDTASGSRQRWSDVEACDRLYLRSEMLLSESRRYSGSRKRTAEMESGRRVINERSVSELTGMSRFKSNNNNNNNEVERERKGAGKRWLDWISQTQNKSMSDSGASVGAGATTSSFSAS